jgi:hypothetical protein
MWTSLTGLISGRNKFGIAAGQMGLDSNPGARGS